MGPTTRCALRRNTANDLSDYFRLSASSIQTNQLRRAFEDHASGKKISSVCAISNVDGHTAANVLKQFLRQLAEPLISDEVLKISQETNCVSDEAFAEKVRFDELFCFSMAERIKFLFHFCFFYYAHVALQGLTVLSTILMQACNEKNNI